MQFWRLVRLMLLTSTLTEVRDETELLRACACVIGVGAASSVSAMAVSYSRIRTRHYLTRPVLSDHERSAWRMLKNSKNDMAYLELTGLTCDSFKRSHKIRNVCTATRCVCTVTMSRNSADGVVALLTVLQLCEQGNIFWAN